MQNLINKFSSLVGDAQALITENKRIQAELDQRKAQIVKDRQYVDEKLAEFSKREAAILPVENLKKEQASREQ